MLIVHNSFFYLTSPRTTATYVCHSCNASIFASFISCMLSYFCLYTNISLHRPHACSLGMFVHMAVLEHHEVHHVLQWTSFSGRWRHQRISIGCQHCCVGRFAMVEICPLNADFESRHHAPPWFVCDVSSRITEWLHSPSYCCRCVYHCYIYGYS